MIKLSSRRSGKSACVVYALHDTCHDCLVILLREVPCDIAKYLGKVHAWFMRYMTHVMTTWLFVEGSPLRDCKIPMPVQKSVYQHAWFMRYMTHVMTAWLFVEGSPL